MKPFRVNATVLICASLMALAACGGEETTDTAGSSPSASSSVPSSSAPSPSAATGGSDEKQLCESVKKAGEEMKAAMISAVQAGKTPSEAEIKKALTDMNDKLAGLVASGGDGPVATAAKQFAAASTKAATAADPATAADDPAYTKAGEDLAAACKAAGVDLNL